MDILYFTDIGTKSPDTPMITLECEELLSSTNNALHKTS